MAPNIAKLVNFYWCCCGDKQCVRHETAITANSTKFPTLQCFKKKENAGCGTCSSLSPWPTDTVFLHLYLVPREILALWLCICLISKISSGVLKIELRSTLTPSYPPVVWLSQQSDANQLDQCWKSPKNFRRRDLSTNCNGFWELKVAEAGSERLRCAVSCVSKPLRGFKCQSPDVHQFKTHRVFGFGAAFVSTCRHTDKDLI